MRNSRDINKVLVKGEVTREPQINITKRSEKKVSNFKVVTKRKINNNVYTEYHTIVAYDILADFVESNIKVGDKVFVDGRLQTSAWVTLNGHPKQTTEIVAHEIELLN